MNMNLPLGFKGRGGDSESFRRGGRAGCLTTAPQQTAGVWVVVNHPEMSLFRGLNEAPTTKGGPACSRTACPPAPDAHNSFIQEPHVHTKAPKSIRHPATLDNASNLLRIEASNEGTAFREDQTAGLPVKASPKKTHFKRGGLGSAGCSPSTLRRAWWLCGNSPCWGYIWPGFEQSSCLHRCKGQGV